MLYDIGKYLMKMLDNVYRSLCYVSDTYINTFSLKKLYEINAIIFLSSHSSSK